MLRLVLACLAIGLVAAPAANAASVTKILRDCADDGVLQGNYSPSELRKARNHIPTDTDEYTDCRDVLARAAAAVIAGGGAGAGAGAPGGGASFGGGTLEDPNTPEGQEAIGKAAAKGQPDPVELGGRSVVPGTAGFAAGAVRNGVPTMLTAALALLAAAGIVAATPFLRRTVTPFLRSSVIARFRR